MSSPENYTLMYQQKGTGVGHLKGSRLLQNGCGFGGLLRSHIRAIIPVSAAKTTAPPPETQQTAPPTKEQAGKGSKRRSKKTGKGGKRKVYKGGKRKAKKRKITFKKLPNKIPNYNF